MDAIFLITIIILLVLGFGVALLLILKRLNSLQNSNSTDNASILLQNQINSVIQNVDAKLAQTNKIIQEQLNLSNQRLHQQNFANNELLQKISENNNKILQEVTEKLVKVEDTNKQVVNFAEQLQSLENILKNPKQRGLLGEYFLETMLSNILPASIYKMQYGFQDGVIVDAVIFTKDKIIPIDAKFSLEACNKMFDCNDKELRKVLERDFLNDVKKRIDETSKYIKPEENTLDIAFMFVPADGVYQEIIRASGNGSTTSDIVSYAYSKKVIIVSPTSFFAYLQTVVQALKTVQIEEQVQDIIKYLNESTKYLQQFEENMNKLGKNIGVMVNSFNRANDEARKLSIRIAKITKNERNLLSLDKVSEDAE